MVELKGPRVLLRRYRKEDASRLAEIGNNKKIARNMRYVFPSPYTLEDAKKWIKRVMIPNDKEDVFGIEFEGELVGEAGLEFGEKLHEGVAGGGYWLGEDYWSKGIATEAWTLLRDYAFENFDIRKMEAGTFGWNSASMKVLKKCGFIQEGCLRRSVLKFEEVCDGMEFGLLREEWEALKNGES